MSIYVHEGRGHWIGSVVVVWASTSEQAVQIVRKYLDDNGLPQEAVSLRLASVDEPKPGIIYAQNGDY